MITKWITNRFYSGTGLAYDAPLNDMWKVLDWLETGQCQLSEHGLVLYYDYVFENKIMIFGEIK